MVDLSYKVSETNGIQQYMAGSLQFRYPRRVVCTVELNPGLLLRSYDVGDARANVRHLPRKAIYLTKANPKD